MDLRARRNCNQLDVRAIAPAKITDIDRRIGHLAASGDAAWVSSTSTTNGEFRGRVVHSTGAELMVLRRTPDGWRIAAIHWSSRARRAP